VHPRVYQALTAPVVDHLDPCFFEVMDETREGSSRMMIWRSLVWLHGTETHETSQGSNRPKPDKYRLVRRPSDRQRALRLQLSLESPVNDKDSFQFRSEQLYFDPVAH